MLYPQYEPLPPLPSDSPLVSVVMFCRNRAYCLRQAIESVRAQTYSNWELVIQDGASTDGSVELIQSFRDPRLKLVSEPDNGPFDAMWRALKRCQGEIIGFCLSDEQWLPLALMEGVRYFLCHPQAAALSRDLLYTDLQGTARIPVESSEFSFHDYLGQQSKLSLVTVLLRRLAVEKCGLYERSWRQDCADFELLARIGDRFRFDYYPGTSALFAQGHAGQLSTTPEVGFFCTQGHWQFIDQFYREVSGRHLLRDLALQNAFEPVQKLYAEKGSMEIGQRLAALYASLQVQAVVPSSELVEQAAHLGLLDLALSYLQAIPPSPENYREWLARCLELFAFFPQQPEALEKWLVLASLHHPGARERWLINRLRVGSPDLESTLREQQNWGQWLIAQAPTIPEFRPRTRVNQNRRIGFLTNSWSTPESQCQIRPLLPYLLEYGWEVVVFGSIEEAELPWPSGLSYLPLPEDSLENCTECLRSTASDILIQLSPLSTDLSWKALAARCAPVQIAYLGHQATTGLAAIDYLLLDETLAPAESAHYFSEQILRLPSGYTAYTFAGQDLARGRQKLDERLVFGSFASCSLMNSCLLDAWIELLRRVPNSFLLLANPEANCRDVRAYLRHYFAEQKLAADRLLVVAREEGEIPKNLLAQIDLYLDTFPHNDALGVARALSGGIPAVSLAGRLPSSRQGLSLLNMAGFSAGNAQTPADYLEKAAELVQRAPCEIHRAQDITNVSLFASRLDQVLRKVATQP